ncbi:MAG: Asp-tRNA(Asn)/Glu-tRNA(Gln) amidotransferase subunit GatA [Candidatus Omnitrophota bacterium]|nr:Asp-tRNA(Asn)/Glu-tRNA(Gln) amidotransferase subunit GatA [Candidatus Omnitrophota bacterium]
MDNKKDLFSLTAGEITGQKHGTEELVSSLAKRVEAVEKKVHAFAKKPQARGQWFGFHWPKPQTENCNLTIRSGPLSGIPVSIKDNICVKDDETTCASKILSGFKPPYDAEVIRRLKDAGAILWGKTNMDEFAFGSSTENSSYGPTRNPHNLECVPGGSSGGSAAAVAADETIISLGSDTGGSIRQPAAFCGVVGLKPTYGRVSRYGLIAFASSLDQIGPITKDVRDCAVMMNIISGYDPKDSTSANIEVPDFTKSLNGEIKNLRVGLPKEYFTHGMDNEVKAAMDEAIATLKTKGAKFIEISLPHTEYAVAVYYIVATAEASSNLARFDGVQYGFRQMNSSGLIDMYKNSRGEGFGNEAKRRIILGTYVLSSGYYDAYYLRAQKVRTLIKRDFDTAFKEIDCIITPTSPTPAFKIGEKATDPLKMYLSDIYTISVNLAGVPAISIPCGFTKEKLPVGLQIIAKPFDEEMLFKAAFAYESQTNWRKIKPKL